MNLQPQSYEHLDREQLLALVERREETLRRFQSVAEDFICASFEFCDKRSELIALIAQIDREIFNINTGRK